MNYTDRIFPTNKGLTTYLDELVGKNYQIPTFQRYVVWQQENVKKLWDSIYKFYPLGSILVWKTDLKLQNHRSIGGHEITDPGFSRTEYQYILDGQQRTTSLLTSLYGGSIADRPGFDPLLYVDLTIPVENDTDDESYKSRFLFWTEIDDQNGRLLQNAGRKKRFDQGVIVKLIDIKNQFIAIQNQVFNSALVNKDFNHPVLQELSKIKGVLDNYRISFIEVKGIQVAEVCQIFERINQAGKPLDIFDIVVAKTFRPSPANGDGQGFYLRDLIGDFRATNQSEFLKISDIDYLQILAVIIGRQIPDGGVLNITDRYLNEIKTEHITAVWPGACKAMLKMFDFLENHLHIHSPSLVPYRYFYFSIASYFYGNSNPDYELLKKYFWFHSFHNEDLLSNTTQLRQHLDFLDAQKKQPTTPFGAFQIDRQKLRGATYSSKGRWSRAILSLYASLRPKDWEHTDKDVLAGNLFFSTDKPNLHHIFPTNSAYVLAQQSLNRITSDSLMNIAYLPQITNLDISNRDPLSYLTDYDKKPEFETLVMPSHLLPEELLDWARKGQLPTNAIDVFIEERVKQVLATLRERLPGIQISEIDTLA